MPKWIYVAGASGLISFGLPRILVGAGVALDAWFIAMGQALGAATNWINPEMALWVITVILGLLLFGFESWKHPVQRLWERGLKIGRAQTDAGTTKQLRVGGKQRDPSRAKPKPLIRHDKLRDTERWPGGDGYNVKFRVLNDSGVLFKGIGARIRTLEFWEERKWHPYGHDYAEVPLATRDGRAEFDLRDGDEESVYIARRSLKPGESIQLCYARDGTPNTIPLKPAWRVGIRLVSDNAPPVDAMFQLGVGNDGSLVGTLFDQTRIVLSEATIELYEQTKQTVGIRAMESMPSFNRSKLLGFMAQKLVNDSVAAFGRCPPAHKHEKIPADHAAEYQFNDDATEMYDILKPANRYIDLEIMRGDLERRISELLAASNSATSNDVELFRRDLFFIKERITSYERFDDYKDEYYRRFATIQNADLTIFTNEQINQWRRDFLNRAGILAWQKSNPPSDRTEEAVAKNELLAIWKSLDDALS